MTDTIETGNIFLNEKTSLPNASLVPREAHSSGWASVTGTRPAIDKEIQASGWTLFFLAGEVKATVFGFDKKKSMGVALKRLMADATAQNCNGIEITAVANKSFLKLPYVSVSAHPRHLQLGILFTGRQ